MNVCSIPDLKKPKTEAGLKGAFLLWVEDKDYLVKDGDVMHFLFTV